MSSRLLPKRPRSLTLMATSPIRAISSNTSSSKSVVAARASPSSAAAADASSSSTLGAGSLKRALAEARSRVAEALRVADAPGLRQRLAEREREAEDPQLWEKSSGGQAQALLSEVASLRSRLTALASFETALEDAAFALELLEAEQHQHQEGKDDDSATSSEHAEIVREALEGLSALSRQLDAWELSALLSGPHDRLGAHVTITAGAGGADAMDWAAMLERMYTRWAHARGYKVTVEDRIVGEEAGVKTSELLVEGELAYGWLRGERGTHRLVRSSPFNAKGLRQTSFAGVEVVPLLPENDAGSGSSASQLDLPERDLQWTFQRSGGKGGQNVNKVESGVRLLHIPTGLAVKSTQERSQQQNRAIAFARLKAKLLAALEDQRASELAALRGDAVRASWGQQVRNYVLHPYTLVKDSRGEGWETADAQGVLDGGSGLEGAMAAVLRATAAAGAREANQH